MAELARFPIKYIRDYIKKDYKLRDCCYICGSLDKLELHHLYSVSELFSKWCDANKIRSVDTVEDIKKYRIIFAQDCAEQLGHDNLYTLCDSHHKRLHNIYGQTYANSLVPKIKNWLSVQKDKNGG